MLLNKFPLRIFLYTTSLIFLDQFIKLWMINYHPSLVSLNQAIIFGSVTNIVTILFLLALSLILLLWLVITNKKTVFANQLASSLIFAGVISNIVDRLVRTGVVDYISISWWPTFNLADIFIIIGVVFFSYSILVKKIMS